jgi:hypothetical protein
MVVLQDQLKAEKVKKDLHLKGIRADKKQEEETTLAPLEPDGKTFLKISAATYKDCEANITKGNLEKKRVGGAWGKGKRADKEEEK